MVDHRAALDEREAKRHLTIERAARLGLTGPLGSTLDAKWSGIPTPREAQLVEGLLDDGKRMAVNSSSRSNGRLDAALNYWERFAAETPHLRKFLPLGDGPLRAANIRHNRRIKQMFKDYMLKVKPVGNNTSGTTISAGCADGYASALVIFRSIQADEDILGHDQDITAGKAAKQRRIEEGPRGKRKGALGIHGADIKKAYTKWDFSLPDADLDYACVLWMHNTISRGADPGVKRKGARPDPLVDMMWSHLQWASMPQGGSFREFLTSYVVPSKDTNARQQRCPIPSAKRAARPDGSIDPLCVCHFLRHAWTARSAVVPRGLRATTLFFTHSNGTPYCAEDVERLAKKVAFLAGWPMEQVHQVGAKAFRIGACSDLYEDYGPTAAPAIIKRRGRWGSDVFNIYARTSLVDQLDASARVGNSSGLDMERAFPGWVQPAV